MRKYVFVLLLLMLAACQTEPPKPKLNFESLTAYAVSQMSQSDLKLFATEIIKESHPSIHWDKDNDIESWQSLQTQLMSDWKAKKSENLLHMDIDLYFSDYDYETNTLKIKNPLKKGKFELHNSNKDGLPVLYQLFYINPFAFNELKVPLDIWQEIREGKGASTQLFASIGVELFQFFHKDQFQVGLKHLNIYKTAERKNKLFELTIPENLLAMNQQRLLSDGISLDLVPLHSFRVLGIRLLDPFIDTSAPANDCKKTRTIKSHQEIVCTYDMGTFQLKRTVVGGLNASISLYTTEKTTLENYREAISRVSNDMKVFINPYGQEDKTYFGLKVKVTPIKDYTTFGQEFLHLTPVKYETYLEESDA